MYISYSKTTFIFAVMALCALSLYAQESQSISLPVPIKINDPQIIGSLFPQQVHDIIAEFKHINLNKEEHPNLINRAILHGPHGTGKTTITKYVAQETDSEYIFLSGSSLLNTFQNSGATLIKTLGIYLKERAKNPSFRAVVVIDEADKTGVSEAKDNLDVALTNTITALWQMLDDLDLCPRIRIFLTANRLDKIPSVGLKSRFLKKLIIYVPGLDETTRKKYLQYFFRYYQIKRLYMADLKAYVNQIEQKNKQLKVYLENHFNGIEQTLYTLNYEISNYDRAVNNADELQKINGLLNELQVKHTALIHAVQTGPSATESDTLEIISEYSDMITKYNERMRSYLEKPSQTLTPEQLNKLTQETDGFSIRYIMALMVSIHREARLKNNNIVTDAMIWEELALLKEESSNDEKLASKKEDREKQRELQEDIIFRKSLREYNSKPHYASGKSSAVSGSISVPVGATGVNAQINLNGTSQRKQNPTLKEAHQLAAKSDDPVNKQASALIQKQDNQQKQQAVQQSSTTITECQCKDFPKCGVTPCVSKWMFTGPLLQQAVWFLSGGWFSKKEEASKPKA